VPGNNKEKNTKLNNVIVSTFKLVETNVILKHFSARGFSKLAGASSTLEEKGKFAAFTNLYNFS
jgi:hypothetical protein